MRSADSGVSRIAYLDVYVCVVVCARAANIRAGRRVSSPRVLALESTAHFRCRGLSQIVAAVHSGRSGHRARHTHGSAAAGGGRNWQATNANAGSGRRIEGSGRSRGRSRLAVRTELGDSLVISWCSFLRTPGLCGVGSRCRLLAAQRLAWGRQEPPTGIVVIRAVGKSSSIVVVVLRRK